MPLVAGEVHPRPSAEQRPSLRPGGEPDAYHAGWPPWRRARHRSAGPAAAHRVRQGIRAASRCAGSRDAILCAAAVSSIEKPGYLHGERYAFNGRRSSLSHRGQHGGRVDQTRRRPPQHPACNGISSVVFNNSSFVHLLGTLPGGLLLALAKRRLPVIL